MVIAPFDRKLARAWMPYAVAILLTFVTLELHRRLTGMTGAVESVQLIFVVPIILTAYLGGLLPGAFATLLCALTADYFVLAPVHQFGIASSTQTAEWLLLLIVGAVLSVLTEALHRSRARADHGERLQGELARIVATAPGVIYSFLLRPDGSSCFPYVSPGLRNIFGLEPAQLERDAAPVFAMMADGDAARIQAHIVESVHTLAPWRDEFQIHRADGVTLWLEGHSQPQRLADGSVHWHGFVNDITERKRVDTELRTTRETLSLLIEQAPVSIAMLDRQMRYVGASRRWHEQLGRGHDVLIGKSHYEVHPDIPDRWREVHQACLAGEIRSEEADLWVHDDGTRQWLRWAIHPWRTGAGDVGGIIIFVEDITERIQVSEAQQRADRRYRDLVDMSPDAILVGRNRMVVFANAAAEQLFGASLAELAGRQMLDLIPVEDHPLIEERIRALQQDERIPPLRHRIIRSDGTLVHTESVASSFTDQDGFAAQVVFRDINAQRRNEEAIREREARLSGIIHSAMDAIITIDEDERIVLANPAAEQIFLSTADEMLGRTLTELLPTFHRDAHRLSVGAPAEDQRRTGQRGTLRPLVGLRANREEFPLEASISHVEIGGRSLSTVIMRDITERQRSEQALKASDDRFRQLAESIREVFWLTSEDKSALEYVSPAYASIWGRDPAQLYESPKDWMEAIHEEDRERVRHAAMTKQAMGTYDEEYRIVRPDGTERWIRDRAFPVYDASGRVIKVAGTAQDVTERRMLEAQLRQTQKLESIGLMAGGIAHDFNNWLTVISGNSELLLEAVQHDALSSELVNEIRHAGDRAAALTRQLLAFSRKQVLEPRVVDLNLIVADTEKMLRRLIGEDVLLTTRTEAVGHVKVDPGHIVQVLMNLAVNARDAMPTGGALTIETADVFLDAEYVQVNAGAQLGQHVQITITDTGTGMAPDVRARLFEPFFTTKAVGYGTGLGLAVVHGIVEQSGGHVTVSSEPGTGTSFCIVLPTVAHSPTPATGTLAVVSPHGTETVLVVEDDENVRRIAVRTLRQHGYTILEAPDGATEVADAVRTLAPGAKVMFASGYTDDAVVRHGVRHADVPFLQKPYTGRILLARVREVLG